MKYLMFTVITILLVGTEVLSKPCQELVVPPQVCGKKYNKDIIPDAQTAIKVAEAILLPIYGENSIAKEQPFKAELSGETWTIKGSMSPNREGGVAIVTLSKVNGQILSICHGK